MDALSLIKSKVREFHEEIDRAGSKQEQLTDRYIAELKPLIIADKTAAMNEDFQQRNGPSVLLNMYRFELSMIYDDAISSDADKVKKAKGMLHRSLDFMMETVAIQAWMYIEALRTLFPHDEEARERAKAAEKILYKQPGYKEFINVIKHLQAAEEAENILKVEFMKRKYQIGYDRAVKSKDTSLIDYYLDEIKKIEGQQTAC